VQRPETLNKHDHHDRVLVARYAAGDAYESEVDDAKQLLDSCAECAALASDIRLISARTSELPAARRPRDFRITREQAERLRGSWFDRLMRNISAPGSTVVRPLAGAALAVGIALVVVGALPLGSLNSRTATDAAPGANFGIETVTPATEAAGAPQRPGLTNGPRDNSTPDSPSAVSSGTGPQPAGSAVAAAASATTVDAGATGVPVDTQPETSVSSPDIGPPKTADTPVPGPAESTSVGVAMLPSAPPAAHNDVASTAGNATVPANNTSALNQTALVLGGLLLVVVALAALALVWFARRRYSDPLVR
jgi:hypothetical protein